MLWQYEYDAWGNILSQSGTMATVNPFRYAGYMYDEETGLYYLMARYYDAKTGRFITRDIFHGYSDNPQSINLYAYTQNNPVYYVDPDGRAAIGIWDGSSFSKWFDLNLKGLDEITSWASTILGGAALVAGFTLTAPFSTVIGGGAGLAALSNIWINNRRLKRKEISEEDFWKKTALNSTSILLFGAGAGLNALSQSNKLAATILEGNYLLTTLFANRVSP